MTLFDSLTFFGIMLLLAALPSASVALVVTRSLTAGPAGGIAAAAGIVLGDLVFITLALLGLSAIAETMGGVFLVIRYLGALYLIWLGLTLLARTGRVRVPVGREGQRAGIVAGFLAGLLLTLGDVKAILFYMSLFPLFVDPAVLEATDIVAIIALTVASVGGVKIAYALLAARVAAGAGRFAQLAGRAAGGVMVAAGGWLVAKA